MLRQSFIFFIKGFGIGSADLVPGISGATIALVLNVYQPFIRSIKRVLSLDSFKFISKFRWRKWSQYVHLEFILPLVLGIFTCIFSLAFAIAYVLENHPIPFWSFFFGLILASALVLPNYTEFSLRKGILVLLGGISGYLLISLHTMNTPDTPVMTVIAGMISIGAMLLPGISGSFMLVIIGKYTLLIHAIKDFNFEFLALFFLGALLSLILLPRIITFIFKSGKEWFILFISGFLIGSLKKIWPWRLEEPVTEVESVVSPFYYQTILNQNPQLVPAVFFGCLGVFLILLIQYLEKKFNKNKDVPDSFS